MAHALDKRQALSEWSATVAHHSGKSSHCHLAGLACPKQNVPCQAVHLATWSQGHVQALPGPSHRGGLDEKPPRP
jgi:hypothetical protein